MARSSHRLPPPKRRTRCWRVCVPSPRSRQVWISVGSIAIKAPGGKIINRGYMLDDQGNIRGRYDKIHLFDVQISETESTSKARACCRADKR